MRGFTPLGGGGGTLKAVESGTGRGFQRLLKK
jgi:hypothetical protein